MRRLVVALALVAVGCQRHGTVPLIVDTSALPTAHLLRLHLFYLGKMNLPTPDVPVAGAETDIALVFDGSVSGMVMIEVDAVDANSGVLGSLRANATVMPGVEAPTLRVSFGADGGDMGSMGDARDGGTGFVGVSAAQPGDVITGIWSGGGVVYAVGNNATVTPVALKSDGSGTWTSFATTFQGGGPPRRVTGIGATPIIVDVTGNVFIGDSAPELAIDPNDSFSLPELWAASLDEMYVVGESGEHLVYHRLGGQWKREQLGYGDHLFSVWGSSAGDVYLGGDGQDAFHGDGSGAWTRAAVPGMLAQIVGIWGSGPDDVWAIQSYGAEGAVVRKKAPSDWAPVPLFVPGGLAAISGCAGDDVWIVGDGGFIAHWDGQGWSKPPSGTTARLTSVFCAGPNDVWIGGHEGTILHGP